MTFDLSTLSPPAEILDLAGPRASWALTSNRPDRAAWTTDDMSVVAMTPDRGNPERLGLTLLGSRWPVSGIRRAVATDDHHWLATDRLPGHTADRVDQHGDVQGVAATAADALADLHRRIEPDTIAGLESGWEALANAVRVAAGACDPAELPDPYRRYDIDQLVSFFVEGRPADEELVVCHGRATLANLVIDPTPVGWTELGWVRVADRHFDLAAMQRSLHQRLGPEAVFAFFERYDAPVDLIRLDHYTLAHHLLGTPA